MIDDGYLFIHRYITWAADPGTRMGLPTQYLTENLSRNYPKIEIFRQLYAFLSEIFF